MRKNALQIVTLGLCIVLLVVTIRQGRKLEEYHGQLSTEMTSKYAMIYNDLEGISARIERKLEEGAKLVADYGLQPAGLNKESRSLLADMTVTLKEWNADTAVTLLIRLDGEEQALPMIPAGNGAFACGLELSTEQECEIWMDIVITSGGMTRREALGSVGNVSALLPIQMHSWGGSAPVYESGMVSIGNHSGDLEMRSGGAVKVTDVCYRLYVNGEKVKEEAVCENWLVPCSEGDEVRLTLFCRDEYGLGYEFTLQEFVCDADAGKRGTGDVGSGGSSSLVLSWN